MHYMKYGINETLREFGGDLLEWDDAARDTEQVTFAGISDTVVQDRFNTPPSTDPALVMESAFGHVIPKKIMALPEDQRRPALENFGGAVARLWNALRDAQLRIYDEIMGREKAEERLEVVIRQFAVVAQERDDAERDRDVAQHERDHYLELSEKQARVIEDTDAQFDSLRATISKLARQKVAKDDRIAELEAELRTARRQLAYKEEMAASASTHREVRHLDKSA